MKKKSKTSSIASKKSKTKAMKSLNSIKNFLKKKILKLQKKTPLVVSHKYIKHIAMLNFF